MELRGLIYPDPLNSEVLMQDNKDEKEIELIKLNTSPQKWIANSYIKAATSDHTRKAYRSDIIHFENWGGKLPASAVTIIQYLESFAPKLNPRTLARRLIALKHWHNYQGFPDPTSHPLIQKTLTGITRVHGKPRNKARPLLPDEIKCIANYLDANNELSGLRDSALILIGYFGALRRSELVAIQYQHIRWEDRGIEILLPASKTDPEREGQYSVIPYGSDVLCPILALQKWLSASDLKSGAIFRGINAQGNISLRGLSALAVNNIIKLRAKQAGLQNPHEFSSHSLRRGLATSAAQCGAPLQTIMRAGRWKQTNTVIEYIEAGERFSDNAASNVLKTFTKT